MADSIAKLAVIITGDASPLETEVARVESIVKKMDDPFQRGLARLAGHDPAAASAALDRLKGRLVALQNPLDAIVTRYRSLSGATEVVEKSTLRLNTVLSASRGNLGSIATVASARGSGPIVAMAAMAFATYKLAGAADSLNKSLGASKLDTWAGQWMRLKDQVGNSAGIFGQPFAAFAREATEGAANRVGRFNDWISPETRMAEERMLALAKATKMKAAADKLAAAEAKKHAAAMKEAAEVAESRRQEHSEWMRDQFSRAEQIKDAMMTAGEHLRRDQTELRSLFQAGFLDESTAASAMLKARKKFDDANKPKSLSDKSREGIGAYDRSTMEGFSAVQSGLRDIAKLEQVAKDQLKAEEKQAELIAETNEILRNQRPIVLMEGTPP
jgi:hypothetical protein